ncbi:MAG: glycosyltransferase family 39 protein [Oscillatoria sp. SIO1A7]|nr:glycosyltransferase family 39 protein [Oscillatoria sp. SIO1A7]
MPNSQFPIPNSQFRILSVLWLLLIGSIAFFWHLGGIGLVDETEPLFAEAARQMTVTGDWVTPYFNGETRFDKPPLIYWLMAIAYKLVGVNEWAVRLPSALAAIALMLFVFFTLIGIGNINAQSNNSQAQNSQSKNSQSNNSQSNNSQSKNFQPKNFHTKTAFRTTALLSAAMMAMNIETIAWGRIGVSDMLLTGCICSALLAFFLGYAESERYAESGLPQGWLPPGWYLAFYILMALAVLTKGPIGIVLPLLIIGCFLIYVGKLGEVLREIKPISGMLVFLAIAVPWYILVIAANGENYINSFFGYHNFERFTRVVNRHGEPWYFYFGVVLLGFAPWSVYLPLAIARLQFWKRKLWCKQPRSKQLGLFVLFWFLAVFGFFSIAATKLPSYVLPLMPAAAILVALLFTADITADSSNLDPFPSKRLSLLPSAFVNIVFLLLLAGALLYLPQILETDPAMPNFPQLLQESGALYAGAAILAATAALAAIFSLQKRWRWLWSYNLVGFIAFLLFALMPTIVLFDADRQLPLRQIAEIIVQEKHPEEETIMIAFEKPSLVFYTQEPITFFRRSTNAREYLQKQAASQGKPSSVLILGWPNKLRGAGLRPKHYQDIFYQIGSYQLVRVDKQVFLDVN